MRLIRSAIYFVCMLIITVISSILIVLSAPLQSKNVLGELGRRWAMTNSWWLNFLCGLNYKVHQAENIPAKGDVVIYMANHQSAWETVTLREILPPLQTWVLKKELLYIPFFGWALKVYKNIAIDRKAGKKALKQLIHEGIISLEERGCSVIIFPEGTRVGLNENKKFNIGGAMLAAKSGYPVVPLAHNAGAFWQKDTLLKLPGTIDIIIGEKIETKGKKATQINEEVKAAIDEMRARLPITKSK